MAGKVRSYQVKARMTIVHHIDKNTLETMTIEYSILLNCIIKTRIIRISQISIALLKSVEAWVREAASHHVVFCSPSGKGWLFITLSIAKVISVNTALLVLSA